MDCTSPDGWGARQPWEGVEGRRHESRGNGGVPPPGAPVRIAGGTIRRRAKSTNAGAVPVFTKHGQVSDCFTAESSRWLKRRRNCPAQSPRGESLATMTGINENAASQGGECESLAMRMKTRVVLP